MSNIVNRPKFSLQISSEGYQNLIKNTLGDKKLAQNFVADISTLVGNNPKLQQCEIGSVVSGGLTAYALHLPMNPSLGYCYLVPYKNRAQLQIGWKGLVQLAIRTEKYKGIGTNPVRESEYLGVDKRTREPLIEFKSDIDLNEKIVGYMAYFDMTNGFSKTWFMTTEEIKAHARRYSKTYNSNSGVWHDDFSGMAQKTVLKQLLSKYGLLSAEMQKAIQYDQAVIKENGEAEYIDNPNDDTIASEEEKISIDDAKRLFELAKNRGGANKVKEIMKEFGYGEDTPSNEIKVSDYNEICKAIAESPEIIKGE